MEVAALKYWRMLLSLSVHGEKNAKAALASVMSGPRAMMSEYLTAGRTFPSRD